MKTPEGVEASVRRNQKGEVLFLLNHSGEEKKVLLEEDYLDLLGKDRLHKGDFVTLTKNDVKLL
ncbi:Beta-galactosidase C-terminal domain [Anaerostipes sp. MSJ-23]|uniref:Beta-galactosidase C-terminal domain n=1 Tax=Anaerostipes sp. MSJ-23 TaxID=2841520 RepID=UPI0020A0158D|nr:Beta-galactosidase C-terminal domain [Anaerostipes sp. MSJ-23]